MDSSKRIKPDLFWGNGEIRLPKPEGIATTWMFLKAQTGNTHPGATLPFGMVSACAHSGAYPTGYFVNAPSYNGEVPKMFKENCADGFAHFHHSGTGAVGIYYNYFRTTPLSDGRLEGRNVKHPLADEQAEPGYYATTLSGVGVRAELTAGAKGAVHRYRFPEGSLPAIAIDVSNGGLDLDRFRSFASRIEMRLLGEGAVAACAVMEGAAVYMHAQLDDPSAKLSLFNGTRVLGCQELKASGSELPPSSQFGILLDCGSSPRRELSLKIGFSFKSLAQAKANCQALPSFDEARSKAAAKWTSFLDRIEVKASPRVEGIFKSAFYHSLVKPSDCFGESPFDDAKDFYLDFSTMWDIYKTQLPLLAMLYPEQMAGIVNSLLDSVERTGSLPNSAFIANFEPSKDDVASGHRMQARSLACHSILDAFRCGVPGIDWRRALDLMAKDVFGPHNDDFVKGGLALPFTHTLDLAAASDCVRQLADALGDAKLSAVAAAHARKWISVYDPATALLKEGEYYEGTLWNYSFRLLHDMPGRIALCGRERFIELLDKFFGYGAAPAVQMSAPDDDFHRKAYEMHRFEGLNNEPDMETPFSYLYAGRHDRAAEIVRAGMRYMFAPGRGGAPGNVDSGGLSAWYVWNALGLFPAAGQDLVLIGSPAVDSASLRLPNGTLSIEVEGNSEESVYVSSASWNGKRLESPFLKMSELVKGGELRFSMSSEPSKFMG